MENIHYGGLRLLYEKGWSFKSPPIFRGVVRYFFIQISTPLPPPSTILLAFFKDSTPSNFIK